MNTYVIDSYTWVEYLIGTQKGEVLRGLFQDEKNSFFTVECCLAEIAGWALRNNKNFDDILNIIRANSSILPIMDKDWIYAAHECFEQRKKQKDFGLIDSIILVKQKQLKCKLISGDKHFKILPNVIFLG